MSESEIVKTCVVLMPCAAFIIVTIIGAIHEAIRERHSVNLFKDKEALKLLRYMRGEDK